MIDQLIAEHDELRERGRNRRRYRRSDYEGAAEMS
jgi:hypothetical protein